MGLCLPLGVNEGPYPGRESVGIVSDNFPVSLTLLGDGPATILRSGESLPIRTEPYFCARNRVGDGLPTIRS